MIWDFRKSEEPRRDAEGETRPESSENAEPSARRSDEAERPEGVGDTAAVSETPEPVEDGGEDFDDKFDEDLERAGEADPSASGDDLPRPFPRLSARRRRRGKRLVKKPELPRAPLTPQQRLLILDTWRRSGLPAADFSVLVGVSKHTLYAWRRRFKDRGPAGLEDQTRKGPRGSRLPEITKRAIVMLKEEHPDWGVQRISDMLFRGPGLGASPSAVSRVLHEAGYEFEEVSTRPHADRPRRFERAKPNELWQTDLFTFMLKRQNRRVYLAAFLDDHSRFLVGWGLHSTQSAPLVLEVLRTAITNYNPPKEILTDNGSQYVTWRGRSQFSRELDQRGIKHLVAKPRRPQTLGKVERFWGTLWRELLERSIFLDLEDARRRLNLYVDYYNFQRVHQGVGGLTPADRFFGSAPKVLEMLKRRVQENALEIARNGEPKKSFYLTGQIEGKSVSVRTEGDRVIVEHDGQGREEVELGSAELPPGRSRLDDAVAAASDREQRGESKEGSDLEGSIKSSSEEDEDDGRESEGERDA